MFKHIIDRISRRGDLTQEEWEQKVERKGERKVVDILWSMNPRGIWYPNDTPEGMARREAKLQARDPYLELVLPFPQDYPGGDFISPPLPPTIPSTYEQSKSWSSLWKALR